MNRTGRPGRTLSAPVTLTGMKSSLKRKRMDALKKGSYAAGARIREQVMMIAQIIPT